jgi:hypothetical protein
MLKVGMVEPEQTSIARQRLGNHVSAATNINKEQFPLKRTAANELLSGNKRQILAAKHISMTTHS